jgi:hypothetical protein
MMRNLIVLAVTGLLAFGLSVSTFAGAPADDDADGAVNTVDNCTAVPNTAALPTGACDSQLDGDFDGYGNPCDTDVDNDGGTSLIDVSQTLAAAAAVSSDPNFDFDCDGGASLIDVSRVLADAAAVAEPGPSGLACAGTAPCP